MRDQATVAGVTIEQGTAGGGQARLGVALFVISEAALFGALFGSYYYLRVKSAVWPPEGVHLDMGLASLNTVFLLLSSVTMWWAGRAIGKGSSRGLALGLAATILLGAAFLGITSYEWARGAFRPWSHAYGSVFFTLTGFHALHVFGGVLLMLALLARTLRGRFSALSHAGVEAGSLYWHFVDFIWILVFSTIFVIR